MTDSGPEKKPSTYVRSTGQCRLSYNFGNCANKLTALPSQIRSLMTTPRSLLWMIEKVHNPQGFKLWFNDGQQVTDVVRGGPNLSYRLMVETQGFLDISTAVVLGSLPKNDQTLFLDLNDELLMVSGPTLEQPILIALSISGNGTFSAWVTVSNPQHPQLAPTKIIDRSFNPFPHISPEDVQ